MTRTIRSLGAVASLALVAGLLAACGSSASGGPGVATLASPGAAAQGASPTPGPSTDPQQAMLDYARCMREHGVDMPDPVINESGGGAVTITGTAANAAPIDQKTMQEADAACRHFMDSVVMPGAQTEISQEMKDAMIAFSRCMRDHGVDMPDPVFSNGGAMVQIGAAAPAGSDSNGSGPTSLDPNSSTYKEAQAACQSLMPGLGDGGPGVVVGGGTVSGDGPGFSINGPAPAPTAGGN